MHACTHGRADAGMHGGAAVRAQSRSLGHARVHGGTQAARMHDFTHASTLEVTLTPPCRHACTHLRTC
eukprot:2891264-Alexandrium_andersonii.AAC.1